MRVSLSRPQSLAHRALQRGNTVTIPWGRGVGKSWFVRWFCYLLVAEWDRRTRPGATYPGVRIVMLMPTLEQAKKVHAALTLAELDAAGVWGFLGAKIDRTTWRITFPGGSWVQWVTAERAQNIRGLRCDVIIVDECDAVPKDTFDAVCVPWLSEPHSLGITLLAGTPECGRYGLLYRQHRKGLDGVPHHYSFHSTYRDVPEYVNVERVEREREHTDPALFAREWECDFDAAEGLVYAVFREDFHVRSVPANQRWTEIIVGGDHGYEDPGAFLVIGVAGNGRDATAHVLEEVYQTKQLETWWVDQARRLNAKYGSRNRPKWFLDPSMPARIEALRSQGGCLLGEVDGAINTIDDGVAAVADRFMVRRREDGSTYSKLYVAPECKNTIRELGLYRRKRDPKNREQILDAIEDKHNHAADALRYAIFGRFGKPQPPRGMGTEPLLTF